MAYHEPEIRPQLFYWHREAQASNAEVDYVIQKGHEIIPIEVKASTRGGMRSLYLFLEEKGLKSGVRFSHENFDHMERVEIMPIYAVSRI